MIPNESAIGEIANYKDLVCYICLKDILTTLNMTSISLIIAWYNLIIHMFQLAHTMDR